MSADQSTSPLPSVYHRWNIEKTDDGGFAICRGDHERSVKCQWEYYSLEEARRLFPGIERV